MHYTPSLSSAPPQLAGTLPGDQMLLDKHFQSRHCFVALTLINQKDQKAPLPIFSSPPSFSIASRMTCGSAGSKCLKSLRWRPWPWKHLEQNRWCGLEQILKRKKNTKNSARRISTHGIFICISCSQWFSRFSMSLQRLGSHMVCCEQVR